MPPTTIGPYRIQRELGRGGMGEVYLAHDTRLDRQVAIKALPAHLAGDADRLARFQREAKVLASLNHPGVAAIYGLEEAEGHLYLVLEFVDGDTLADRLADGPIPADEALSIARQITEALEAAHEKGVVHRDLKPGNVMVTHDGVVKVLDFGLARTAEGSPSSTQLPGPLPTTPTATSPARAHSPTIPGAIMGTAGYMSPEQARGKAVDKRSDIFSFGCVLYEMLSGSAPFPGETVTDSLGAILHREPDWSRLPPGVPPRVSELLRNCLAKDRHSRLHDIGDARLELERAISGQEWLHAGGRSARRGAPLRWGLAAAAGLALLAAGWRFGRAFEPPAPAAPAQSFHVSTAVPSKPELGYLVGIAPDARFVVYRAWARLEADSSKPEGVLVIRRLDRDETKVIEGSEGATDGALSADGRWLAYAAARDRARTKMVLKKIALEDGRPAGSPETLCNLPSGGGYSLCWSSDREIIVALQWKQSMIAAPAAGGEPRSVLSEEQSKGVDNWGDLRPLVPGKSILASRWAVVGQTVRERTEIVDLATGKRTPLLQNAGGAMLLPGGLLIARRNQNTLIAAHLDPESLQTVGEPVTVWSGLLRAGFFVSAGGTLAMTTGTADISGRRLMWLDEQGQPQPIAVPPRAFGNIMLSPDGGRVATNLEPSDQAELPTDLWVQDLSRRTLGRVTTAGPTWGFVWSQDGLRLAHNCINENEFSIWSSRADGSADSVKMYTTPSTQIMPWPTGWSPDGRVLAILEVDLAKDIGRIVLLEEQEGSAKWIARPFSSSASGEDSLRFSPDGKWVRFLSEETGRRELYVQPFTAAGANDARSGRRQVSNGGARSGGWWSPDGKEIRYTDLNDQVMSVQVQTEPTFSASTPKVLYSVKDLKIRDSTWAPDGRQMIVVLGENEQTVKIDLVVNFMEEVRSKLAASK